MSPAGKPTTREQERWAHQHLTVREADVRCHGDDGAGATAAIIAEVIGLPQLIIAFTGSPVMRVKASNFARIMPTSGQIISCTSP